MRSMWNGQIIDDTKESYYDFIDEAKDELFENFDKLFCFIFLLKFMKKFN